MVTLTVLRINSQSRTKLSALGSQRKSVRSPFHFQNSNKATFGNYRAVDKHSQSKKMKERDIVMTVISFP